MTKNSKTSKRTKCADIALCVFHLVIIHKSAFFSPESGLLMHGAVMVVRSLLDYQ